MRDRDPQLDDGADRILDVAIDDEGCRIEDDVQHHVPPSFAAIVARAHRIDPRAVGADAIERAGRVTRTPGVDTAIEGDDELAPLVAVLRAEAQRDIARREQLGAPPCGLLRAAQTRHRTASTRRWIAAVSAVAAAAVVVLGLDWLESWSARRSQQSLDSTQSLSAVRAEPEVHDAEHLEPATVQPVVAPTVAPPRAPAPVVEPPAVVLPAEVAPLESKPAPRAVARTGSNRVPADAALRQLDAAAQAALVRGDRTEADQLYARIIAEGKRHPLVEIAFAERFSLARGRGAEAQRGLWAGYLTSFPEGRFADDAHAGLCRVAVAADKAACWQRYVDRFPAGAYRSHADRWFTSAAVP